MKQFLMMIIIERYQLMCFVRVILNPFQATISSFYGFHLMWTCGKFPSHSSKHQLKMSMNIEYEPGYRLGHNYNVISKEFNLKQHSCHFLTLQNLWENGKGVLSHSLISILCKTWQCGKHPLMIKASCTTREENLIFIKNSWWPKYSRLFTIFVLPRF